MITGELVGGEFLCGSGCGPNICVETTSNERKACPGANGSWENHCTWSDSQQSIKKFYMVFLDFGKRLMWNVLRIYSVNTNKFWMQLKVFCGNKACVIVVNWWCGLI